MVLATLNSEPSGFNGTSAEKLWHLVIRHIFYRTAHRLVAGQHTRNVTSGKEQIQNLDPEEGIIVVCILEKKNLVAF